MKIEIYAPGDVYYGYACTQWRIDEYPQTKDDDEWNCMLEQIIAYMLGYEVL